jgi:hypothetical protein
MSGLKENAMSNGEVLAAVNKNSYPKIQNPQNFPQVSRIIQKFYYILLVFKVELEQRRQGGRIQDLDVHRKCKPSQNKL